MLLSQLSLAEYNPRQIDKKKFDLLKQSLKNDLDFLSLRPILVNKRDGKNVVFAGNMRLRALLDLGYTELDDKYFKVVEISIEKEKKWNVKDNQSYGEYDDQLLAELLSGMEIDIQHELGFLDNELSELMSQFMETGEDDFDAESELDKIAEPTSKLGDIYKLGNHRLMCGDSTKKEEVEKLMDGQKADMVFTDPPYGMNLNADYSGMVGMAQGNKYENVIGDNMEYDPKFILDLFNYCKEIILWGADYYAERIPDRNSGSFFVWDKTEGGISPNSNYDKMFGSNFELCWSKTKHKRQIIPCMWKGFFGLSQEDTKNRVHPTQKPTKLCVWFIEKFSKNDNNIIDLFGGSGSTLIACEQLNRKCFMMEIDQKYCDVIIKRWETLTGQTAEKLS